MSRAVITDQKAQNTAGGDFTSGAWQTRQINTEQSDDDSIVAVSSNQFTIGAGKYLIEAFAPVLGVGAHQTRLYNITDTAVEETGMNGHSPASTGNFSSVYAVVDISVDTTYEIQHRCQTTKASTGFGFATNWNAEVYTTVRVTSLDYSIAIISEQQVSGTAAGDFASGAFQTRVLNAENYDADGIVSIATNQFTLQAGEYYIEWQAPAYDCGSHQSQLYNITDASVVELGCNAYNYGPSNQSGTSNGFAFVDIAGAKAFEIQHRCASTILTNGLGLPCSFDTEQYTTVKIMKVA